MAERNQKILIASAIPIFAKGIEKMIQSQNTDQSVDFRYAHNTKEVIDLFITWQPDLIILDYDDNLIQKEKFLEQFVESQFAVQVMLVSLNSSGSVVIYDRRTLTPEQASDWLKIPWVSPKK